MDVYEYIKKMKTFQTNILEFIDDEEMDEINQEQLNKFLPNEITYYELKLILHIILSISNYHYRYNSFFNKIFQIILFCKEKIINNFSNEEILKFFSSNKRIVLFLIEKEIIKIDKYIAKMINNEYIFFSDFSDYFYPEIKKYVTSKTSNEIEDPNFEEKRKIGENPEYICELIRNDMIEEFVIYVNERNTQLNAFINPSIFETNRILIRNQTSLIEYSAFFGSIQIFKYLKINGAKINQNMWKYAIHGKNAEIFHILEKEMPPDKDNCASIFNLCLCCYHTDLANYIWENYINDEFDDYDIVEISLCNYNFAFFSDDLEVDYYENDFQYLNIGFISDYYYEIFKFYFIKGNMNEESEIISKY